MPDEMTKESFKRKLSSYPAERITISSHALLRAELRGITRKDIVENITSPSRLKTFGRDKAMENKYDCWFEYSKTLGHHYAIILNGDAIVVTVIKIRRRWQRRIEAYVKKIQN